MSRSRTPGNSIAKQVAVFFLILSYSLSDAQASLERHVSPAGSHAQATLERHVSPAGNDNWPGTAGKPWKTLEAAFARLASSDGDILLIVEDGEYSISSPLVLEGLKDKKVTVEAAPGASPTIRGDKQVGKLLRVKGKGKILQANLKAAGVRDFGNPCERTNLVDLYWKGERQHLSRWPDEGFLQAGEALGPTRVDDVTRKEGVFTYNEDRISRWASEKDAWIYGYFRWDWSDQYQKVASIDPGTKTINLAEPWHNYGYKSGFRYYGVNLLCELDSPGEYYIDRDKGILYWYPPEEYSAGDEVTVSVYSGDYMLELRDCRNVTISGLAFEGGRHGAVSVSGCEGVLLENIRMSCFGGSAVKIASSGNVRLNRCLMETLGHSGIQATGGDRKTLSKAGYVVSETVVRDFSLFKHTYEPAVFFSGCGLTVTHCEFCGSSSSAMRIDGSEAIVEYNYFHDLVKESDDQGAIDMYFNYGYRGVVIRHNLFRDIKGGSVCGAAGVRFDDMISGQRVYGNIFDNVGAILFGAVQIHGGKDNLVENNVFYKCHTGVSFSPWPVEMWNRYLDSDGVKKQLYEDVKIDSPLYTDRYPELAEDPRDNVNRNRIRNNLAIGCPTLLLRNPGNNVLQNNSALFLGEGTELSKPVEYYLNPEVLSMFGLRPIPFKEIGPEGRKPFL